MTRVTCTIDFFGAAGSQLLTALLNQSSNNRARRVAFNNLTRLAKATGLVPKNTKMHEISLTVTEGGVQLIMFLGMPYEGDKA